MRMYVRAAVAALALLLAPSAAHAATTVETIVFLRHGEKPSAGNGQLTCQGLQRSLALPDVLINRYGRASWFYAPDPNVKISDAGGSFYYVRPLATIEPTVIREGLSVNTSVGFNNINGLESLLLRSSKGAATIYVAWEHLYLQKVVQDLMNKYGGGATIPAWSSGDYDSLYVVRLSWSNGSITGATFTHDYEGLNSQSTSCP
jgi:hypothetical protein